MSRRFVCDWCGAAFDDRDQVAHCEVTVGATAEQLHMCVECAPDFLKTRYPEEQQKVTDGGHEITVEQIATTEDTGDPVFEARCGEAYLTFLFPPEEPHDVWIHHVHSPEPGGMSAMLDFICEEYECESLRFVNVLNDNLLEKVDGGTVVEETFAGETIQCLDVEWHVGGVEAITDGGDTGPWADWGGDA